MASLVEDSLIKTSLIEQVVAPITLHICYLTLLSEADDTTEQFIQLEASARAVAKASRNMADVASRVMAESDDDVMRLEMGLLLEPLIMSGQHVLLATQKLSIQPEVGQHRDELIQATQNVLLGVVKVLLVADEATVRKITSAAHWLLDSLKYVGDSTEIQSLLKAFQAFSKALLSLHNLVMNRVKDMRDHRQQDCVKASVEILRRSISMLHTAMYTTIKHPTSEVAQASKIYILQLVDSTINDIIMALKGNYQCMSKGSFGYYTERRIRLLKSLSDPAFNWYKDSNFDVVLRDLVFHSMDIANSLQREIRSCVTANCKLILQLWTEIQQININCTDKQKPKDHQEKLRISLMIQIHELDEAVVKATLYQVIDTFVLESSPLEQLVNTVHNFFEADLEDGLDMDPIQTLFKTFISHADRMAKVASFVSALATDEKSLEGVENSISCLMRLKDGVLPLLLELEGDSVLYHGALHKLISFHQKWEEETEQLLNAFYNVINVKDFIHLSILEMKHDLDRCQEAHKSQNHHLLRKHLRLLIGRMSQIVQFVRRCVDKSDDPIYRNGLLVLIKQAEKSLAEVTGHATEIFNTNFQEEAFPLLTNSIMVSIKNFDVLLEGLDGLQHPDLLSPLREGARQVTTTPPVPYTEEPKKTTNDQAKIETLDNRDKKEDLEVEIKATLPEKKNPEFTTVHQPETRKATKEAACIVEENNNHEMETLRSELVTLTPLLVQAAQETAMSSVKIIDTVYKHSVQFSDLLKTTHNILLPVTGMWYHAIKAMIHSHTANMVDNCIQELTEVMCLCSDTVELVTLTDIKVRSSESNDSITFLLSKLQKAQTNTKNLADLLVSKASQSDADEYDGPCILWALSIQVLLTTLDRILGTGTIHGRGQLSQHQMSPKKWFAAMSENSLRIQEAARLSSLNCTDSCKTKLLKERDDVKALSEAYLQATDDLGTLSRSEQIKLGLQGKAYNGVLQWSSPSQVIAEKKKANPVNIPPMNHQESKMNSVRVPVFSSLDPSLAYTSLLLKQEAERWDVRGNQIVKVTREMADKIYDMTQYLKRKGPIQSKDAFVSSAKDLVLSCQTVTHFVKVIAEHCLDQQSNKELCIIAERIVTITNQLTIISSVNAVTPACKSSDEILVKNAQNLLQTVIQGVRAAETACIKGLRQPEPNSDAAKAASLCIQWKKNLLIHRTQEQLNPETDDLGLRKTSQQHATPSLAPPISVLERYK
ncbi:uncharacterized protein LOC124401258 [Tachysurus ichikawai]